MNAEPATPLFNISMPSNNKKGKQVVQKNLLKRLMNLRINKARQVFLWFAPCTIHDVCYFFCRLKQVTRMEVDNTQAFYTSHSRNCYA
ncbi:hypothetical protein DPMN_160363 [Dreissena polymorpha]|uniref:Uncharacterized protein n=1 Tax=Dreissena polymorpha TaxID=45954 RepID=A0A9D4ISG6_DREPO|nr:hypothetical protein DPMN_160363 [Dreissena polymorpha]